MTDSSAVSWPRLRVASVVVLALVGGPLAVGAVLGGSIAVLGLVIGSALSAASAAAAGSRPARLAAPVLVGAVVVGSVTAGGWPWVAVVGGLSALAGLANAWQATGPFTLAAIVSTVAPATSDVGTPLWLGAFTALGCAYGLVLAAHSGVAARAEPLEIPFPPWAVAIGLGTVGAVTSSIALLIGDDQAYWIPMTALIVAVPSASGMTARGRERVIGTLSGAAVAIALGILGPPLAVYLVVTVVALVMTVATAGLAYRVQSTFVTILVLVAGGTPRPDVVERRVLFTMLGVAILVTGVVLGGAVARRATDAAR